jgi:hypothetical protein
MVIGKPGFPLSIPDLAETDEAREAHKETKPRNRPENAY